jgi:hypothetical protein
MKYPSVKSQNFSWPSEVFFEQKESFQSIIFYLLISEKYSLFALEMNSSST